jgi:hypothetical protein
MMIRSSYCSNDNRFVIRTADTFDIDQLAYLNAKWCIADLRNVDTSRGFLFGQPFSSTEFEVIVNNQEIVVAEANKQIAAYYLFDNFSTNETSLLYAEHIISLKQQQKLRSSRISRRAQAVVDEDFQGLKLYSVLYATLNSLFKSKYDIVFSMAHKLNPKIAANYKLGWEIIGEKGDILYVAYSIK